MHSKSNLISSLANFFEYVGIGVATRQRVYEKIKKFRSKDEIFGRATTFITGLFFGFSVSIGLGLSVTSSVLFGAMVGFGVYVSGSLIAYLIIQTIVLSGFALLSFALFRTGVDFSIETLIFQQGYLSLILLTPIILLFPGIKRAANSVHLPATVETYSSLLFGLTVFFLRVRMPSDGSYALSKLYSGEDNAGIVSILSYTLKNGYDSYALQLGEFTNSAYLAAAGAINSFGPEQDLVFTSVLTHYNMILLFMAWVVIASFSSLALSGMKFGTPVSLLVISTSSCAAAFLFWPFFTIGHTAVVSAGLFSMALISLTLNKKMALDHPVLFFTLLSALAFVAGNIWFPLMPFSAATVGLALIALLHVQYRKGNKRSVTALVAVFTALSLVLLPTVLNLASNSSGYLSMLGGTRKPSYILAILWGLLVLSVLWRLRHRAKDRILLGSPLFALVLVTLVASNLFLLIAGFVANSGSFGYGASKYFLTTISFSSPVLLIVIANLFGAMKFKEIVLTAIAFLLILTMVQPDTRKVPVSIFFPNLTSWDFLAAPKSGEVESSDSGVVRALKNALSMEPDHLFCVTDYGYPVPGDEKTLDSYFCTRWGESILADDRGHAWAIVPLGLDTVESLTKWRLEVQEKNVVFIRIVNPAGESKESALDADTWWREFVDDSWKSVVVTSW